MAITYSPALAAVEQFPKVSAKFLADLGFFQAGHPKVEALCSSGKDFLVGCLNRNKLDLIYSDYEDYTLTQTVSVEYVLVGAVTKIFFRCPVTDQYCREIRQLYTSQNTQRVV